LEAMSSTTRFSGRADSYAKYRPRYPAAIVEILEREIGFEQGKVVADIGSGTGLLAEIFLQNGNRVYCVEPNSDMRSAGDLYLAPYKNRVMVSGTAEDTRLESKDIDLVTIGQALHWFNLEKTRIEFSRILKPEGYLAVVYNERKHAEGLMSEYEKLRDKHARNRASTPEIDGAYLTRFFGDQEFNQFALPNSQLLDAEGLLGRAMSASYFPKAGEDGYEDFRKDLAELFARYQKEGQVELIYETTMFVGQLA
jgi:SAM-dependent methyltransferase